MNRANPLVLDALDMIKARGLVPTIKEGGKHIKIGWRDQGRNYLLVVARSPSHSKALQHSRAVLKRLLRDAGNGGGHA